MSAEAIRDEIVGHGECRRIGLSDPPCLLHRRGIALRVLIRNEDNFSIQFQNKNGGFHFFQKSELRSIERIENSLMPADYRERLSSAN